MADHALFYNSVDHDRVYNADSFSDWLKKFFTTGVFTGDLFVTASGSMNVSVGTGYVNINGKVMIYGASTTLTLDPANGIYPRIDTIVVERNDTDRDFTLKVVTGDYANLNDPVPTPPVRSGAIYQLVLAQIYVGAGVTEITQANITDTRADADLCGIVTGTVTEMDFSQFAAQFAEYYQEFKNGYEADFDNWSDAQRQNFANWMADEENTFDTWFANLHYILDGDVAGHLQNEIDALAAGMTGSIFEIHTNESTLIGKTVTVTDGTTSMTATISNAGDAEIRGFDEIGNITITATDGDQTATIVVNVPYFSNYPITLAFWQATVNIQGDENLYGEDVQVSNSSHILVQTITLDSAGQGTFYANRADTYTFTATYSGETYSESLAVTEETTYSVSIMTIPNGETVTPTDDVHIWLRCAGIQDKAYTTLSQVLSDSETFNALLGDSNACAYMARCETWTTDICASQYAMSMVGQYDVCCDALLGNATWASAIVASAYADYVLTYEHGVVPVMTSATTPSGVVSSSTSNTGYEAYKVFDNNSSTKWLASSTSSNYVQYEFDTPVKVLVCKWVSELTRVTSYQLSASNDGTNFTPLINATTTSSTSGVFIVSPSTEYKYYRFIVSTTVATYNTGLISLQFFGGGKDLTNTEKIHGTNNEVAYYLDGATETPIVDPSTLSAGTYTFGSTVAKDPSDLTADYTKTIRITPNTKEIVLRPDGALYWWGYEGANLEDSTSANGWNSSGGFTWQAPTHNSNYIYLNSPQNYTNQAVGSKYKVKGTSSVYCVYQGVTPTSNIYGTLTARTAKAYDNSIATSYYNSNLVSASLAKDGGATTATSSDEWYLIAWAAWGGKFNLYALWYE